MLAVCPTCSPFSSISAIVSRPAQTRSTRGVSRPAVKVVEYTHSVRPIQDSFVSFSSRYGSSMRPAASRSVCTHPGTAAGKPVTPPPVRVQPSCNGSSPVTTLPSPSALYGAFHNSPYDLPAADQQQDDQGNGSGE